MPSDRDLFANFERMRREIDDLFGDVFERTGFGPRRGFTPRVDVYYCGTERPRAVVIAELSGVDIAEVALEIRGRQLVIAGERRGRDSASRLYQQVEIEHGPFRRVVDLGADVVAEEAKASYEDGLLRIDLPLVVRETPQRVRIRAESDGP